MESISCRPYKLYNIIKNYEWGTKNENAFIPQFLGIHAEIDTPYAELWIGAHPNASSEIEIEGMRVPLNRVIKEYPLQCLGMYVCEHFSNTFPFLLKVLSAAHALSIQTHPNKSQARKLHAADPKNYPDDNHKPEVAIALDSLIALVGFKPIHSIKKHLESMPELKDLIGEELIGQVLENYNLLEEKALIKKTYEAVMQHVEDKERLTVCINGIRNRLINKSLRSPEEEQFLEQYQLFGDDIGLLSFFFFNLVHLKSGEAIFTDAGVPHAYIKGNICECMANSDNVVRAGLTGKFKDVKTLIDIIRYDFAECPVMKSEMKTGETIYKTTAKEFEVSGYTKPAGFSRQCSSGDMPSVFLITKGSLEIHWNLNSKKQAATYSSGESIFVPAMLSQYEIVSKQGVEYFAVVIP